MSSYGKTAVYDTQGEGGRAGALATLKRSQHCLLLSAPLHLCKDIKVKGAVESLHKSNTVYLLHSAGVKTPEGLSIMQR